jgi:glycosyltransferase involved in cell wall biosynthesis
VVVTAHNYGRFLPECLASLDRQTAPIDELVVVDDASTDDTADVLTRLLASLSLGQVTTVLRHDVRRGAAASLNEGIAHTSGELVANVDADDTVEPRYLELLVAALDRTPTAGYAYPRLRLFGSESGVMASYPFDPGRLVFEGNYIPNVAMMRRRAFDATGGYRDLDTHLDWDLWLSMLEAGWPGVLVDEPLYNWRRHDAAKTLQPLRRRLRARASVTARHRRLLVTYRRDAVRWTWSAVRRRLPGAHGGSRLSPSGWVDSH